MALPFDPDKVRVVGGVVPVAEDVGGAGNTGFGAFSASENGVLLYRSGATGFFPNRTLAWLDYSGKQVALIGEPKASGYSALSPDGKHAAITIATTGGAENIWLQDLDRAVPTKFTFGPEKARAPTWSPDGGSIIFTAQGALTNSFYRKPANSAGTEELLLHAGINAYPSDVSPDGKFLVYSETGTNTKNDLWLLPIQGEH